MHSVSVREILRPAPLCVEVATLFKRKFDSDVGDTEKLKREESVRVMLENTKSWKVSRSPVRTMREEESAVQSEREESVIEMVASVLRLRKDWP